MTVVAEKCITRIAVNVTRIMSAKNRFFYNVRKAKMHHFFIIAVQSIATQDLEISLNSSSS
jgi:hypothetical protein